MMKRVLLVDDEADFGRIFKMILEKTGCYQVEAEIDSTRALATARAFNPHIIFIDLLMPLTDGSQLAADFRADHAFDRVPLVFLTALATQPETIVGSPIHGRRVFVPKPVDWDYLTRLIEQEIAGTSHATL